MFDKIVQLISFFFFGVAIWLIAKEVDKVGLSHLTNLVLSTPFYIILIALLLTGFNYLSLTGYDWTALEYIGKKLPFKTVFKTASIGFAISNTAGHAYASGGAIRYLFYTPCQLSRAQILMIIAFESLSILLGIGVVYIIAIGLEPFVGILNSYPYLTLLYIAAFLVLCGFVAYWLFIIKPHKKLTLGSIQIKAPSLSMTFKQMLVGFFDNFTICLVFYTVLSYHIPSDFMPVFIIFMIAQVLALTSQVPGGMGVFEGLILYLFPHTPEQKGPLLAALIAFRVLYFFVPFVLSGLYIGRVEFKKYMSKNN